MAIYAVDIEKTYQNLYWTNVYHIEASDLDAATTVAEGMITIERAGHYNSVLFTKARVSDLTPFGDTFATIPINQYGTKGPLGEHLPLWNVVRVDFLVHGRRPARKFLRVPIMESDQNSGDLAPAFVTGYGTSYALPMLDVVGLCTITGDPIVGVEVMPKVAMRQLRRGSKRKTTPVLP